MPTSELAISAGHCVLVDASDFDWLSEWRWTYLPTRREHKGYATRWERRSGHRRTIYMHRQIAGAEAGETVLHLNDDGLDNRRSNLLVGGMSLNVQMGAPRSAGFRGVYFDERRGSWYAKTNIDGKQKRLGTFATALEAAAAYDASVLEQHGPFARTNL